MTDTAKLQCYCGKTQLEVRGKPITITECLCNSCRAAAARLERLPGARSVLTDYDATRCAEYRKDRIHFVSGQEHLKEFRLSSDAGTRRVVATCCNTPVFMEMKGDHWVSLYGQLWSEGKLPPVEMRTMVGDLSDASNLPDNVPNLKQHSVAFYVKLFAAWVGMGFRNPRIETGGQVDV